MLPRLHVITDDAVLADPAFPAAAEALLEDHGPAVALHLRGHHTPARALFELAERLGRRAAGAGGLLLVNDRVDIAAALGLGVQLGGSSLPIGAARGLLPTGAVVGASAHSVEEAVSAARDGADAVILGTIWTSASHPDRPGAGLQPVRDAARAASAPVLAIGGVTPERAVAAREAGAYGVAVLSGIWSSGDASAAAGSYLSAIRTEARG